MARELERLRLEPGSGPLEQWAATAGQVDKNAVYMALFAVADGSVFRAYETHDDEQPREFMVVVREDLVIKIHLRDQGLFGLSYIGPVENAA